MRTWLLTTLLACLSHAAIAARPSLEESARLYSTTPWASTVDVRIDHGNAEPTTARINIACWPGRRWTIALDRAEISVEPGRLVVRRPGLSCLVYISEDLPPTSSFGQVLASELPALLAPELVVAEVGRVTSTIFLGPETTTPTRWASRAEAGPWTTQRRDGSTLTLQLDNDGRYQSLVLEDDRGTTSLNFTPGLISEEPPPIDLGSCTRVDSISELLPMDLTRTVGDRLPALALQPIDQDAHASGAKPVWLPSAAFEVPILLDAKLDFLVLVLIDGVRVPVDLVAAYDLAEQLTQRARVRIAEGASPTEGAWNMVVRPVVVFDSAKIDLDLLGALPTGWSPPLQPPVSDAYLAAVPLGFWTDSTAAAAMLASDPVRLIISDRSGRIRAMAPLSATVEEIEQALLNPDLITPASERP